MILFLKLFFESSSELTSVENIIVPLPAELKRNFSYLSLSSISLIAEMSFLSAITYIHFLRDGTILNFHSLAMFFIASTRLSPPPTISLNLLILILKYISLKDKDH